MRKKSSIDKAKMIKFGGLAVIAVLAILILVFVISVVSDFVGDIFKPFKNILGGGKDIIPNLGGDVIGNDKCIKNPKKCKPNGKIPGIPGAGLFKSDLGEFEKIVFQNSTSQNQWCMKNEIITENGTQVRTCVDKCLKQYIVKHLQNKTSIIKCVLWESNIVT